MKTIKLMLTVSLLSISFSVLAAPSETECQITSTIDSPLIGFLKVPLMLSNPLYSIGFVASSYRNSQCPKPELITKEQAQLMIQEAINQYVINSNQANKIASNSNE